MAFDRLEALVAFHAEDPQDVFTRFALAQEYAKRGDVARACELYESIVAMQPSYTGTYYHLGKLYESLGRPAEASAIYRKGIAVATREHAHKDLSELRQVLMELEDE